MPYGAVVTTSCGRFAVSLDEKSIPSVFVESIRSESSPPVLPATAPVTSTSFQLFMVFARKVVRVLPSGGRRLYVMVFSCQLVPVDFRFMVPSDLFVTH